MRMLGVRVVPVLFLSLLGLLQSSHFGHAGVEAWTPVNAGVSSDLFAVRHISTGGYFLAVGAGGRMLTSPDGLSWTPRAVADAWGVPVTADLTGIAEVPPHVVVVGDGVILTGPGSDPAQIASWQVATIGGRSFRGVAANPDTGVVVAVGGIQTDAPYAIRTDVAVSTGGSGWSLVNVGDIGPLNAVIHASGLFVATGWGSQILSSPNGTDWTVRQGLVDFTMHAITYGTQGFLAAGLTGLYYTSADGIAWSDGWRGSSLDVLGAAFGDGTYCTVGSYAGIHTSTDAESWIFRDPGIYNDESARLNAVTFHNHRFWVVGNGGIILRSGIVGTSPVLRVTVEPADAGTTVPAAGVAHEFPLGSEVEITAIAAPGYRFAEWAGDDGGSMPSLTVRLDGDVTVTASFIRQGVERIEGEDTATKRMGHAMAVLPNGKVGLFGGHGWDFTRLDSAEIWDPAARAFSTETMPAPWDGGAFVRLADGRYLLAGGAQADLGVPPGLRSAMVFDPATESFAAVAGQMGQGRMHCRGALLTDGRVLIVGGWFTPASAASGEVYSPASGTFSAAGALNFPRAWPMVLPTADGGAVVAGGTHLSGSPNLEQTEIYDPATNGFTTHTESLFPGEPGWILNTDLPRDLGTQMTAGGEYVLHAYRADTRESALAFFNPVTKSFRRLALTPPLTEFATWTFSPLVNPTRNQAFLVMSNHPPGVASSSSWPVVVDLDSGKRSTAPVSSRTADYWIGGSAQVLLPDGRIYISGGTESVNWYFNFRPVEHTFYLAADYILGPPSVVDHDAYEIRINPTNTHMVRDAGGTLHVAYTRRQWPASAPGYYAYVRRSTDDGETWANRVRTEDMPDSTQVYSLAIAPDGTLHQGFTFNVGTFVTSSGNGGATWSKPTALRDGGWGDYDYSPALAVDAGGALHAVFAHLFGWDDPPANIVAKTRPSAGSGWWNGVALTDYPNSEAFGLGATNPRLCLGPGGRRYALFDQTSATATRRLLAVFDGVRWQAPAALSNPARQGYGGDAAVDSAGWLHAVWIERDHAAANAELRYAVYGPDGTPQAPPRNLTNALSANVDAATVGVYAGDRVVIAYGLADAGAHASTAYHGVFVRSSGDDYARSIRVADHPNARTPGLRSAFGMHCPAKLDIIWVEPAPESEGGGEYLMHRLLVPDDLDIDRGTIAVASSVPDAPFTLTGPRTYAASTGAAGAWTEHGIPVGTYTITWGDKTGYATPAGEAKRLTVGATAAFAGLYVPDDSVVLALDVAPADGSGGTVTLDPAGTPLGAGRFRFPQDTLVALTAAPADGWRLKEWSGALAGEETIASLTLMAGAAVTATFVPRETFTVTTSASPHGAISPPFEVLHGDDATVTITPDPGAEISAVAVNDVPVEAATTVALRDIRGDLDVRAEFSVPRVILHCWRAPQHGGTVASDKDSYAFGETAVLTATPAPGFGFSSWAGDASGAATTTTVTMAGNRAVTARFAALEISGDVDINGVIDVRDAEKAYRMAIGLEPPDLARADLDYSGTVTARDAGLILRAVTDGLEKVVLSQPLAVTADDQVVSVPGRVTVTVPGGLLTEPAELTITEIGAPPAPFRQLLPGSPMYHFDIAGLTEFDRDVVLEFDYDPASLPPAAEPLEQRLLACRWDDEELFWQILPATVDTARNKLVVPVRHFSYFGMFNPWQKTATLDPILVYYDAAVAPAVPDIWGDIHHFAAVVAGSFKTTWEDYTRLGYPTRSYRTFPFDPCMVFLQDRWDDPTMEPAYSWKTKAYEIPVSHASKNDMDVAIAHELFHMVQNQTFAALGNMGYNRALMEMSAEYAARRVPWVVPFGIYALERSEGLTTVNSTHEYANATFLDYLARRGVGFKELWDRLITSYLVFSNFEDHVTEKTGQPFDTLYREFRHAALFDADTSSEY